jgi:hypothetical protein
MFLSLWFFEQVKLKRKLVIGTLKGREWEEVLLKEDPGIWKEIFKGRVDLPEIQVPRFCLHSISQFGMMSETIPRNELSAV